MLPGKRYSTAEIVRILLRRRWMVLVPLALGLVAAAPPVNNGVPKCEPSEALIMVISQRTPNIDTGPASAGTLEQRLASITDRVLSQSRLEFIIRNLDPYQSADARGRLGESVQQMRDDIQVKPEGKDSFRISYENCDPQIAHAVTAHLASLYLEENPQAENPAAINNPVFETLVEDAGVPDDSSGAKDLHTQFRIISTASLPAPPDSRLRPLKLLAGAVAGLVLGLALVGLLEYKKSSFSHEEDVLRVLSLPVLGAIPMMTSKRERQTQRYRRVVVDFGAYALVLWAVALVLWRLRT